MRISNLLILIILLFVIAQSSCKKTIYKDKENLFMNYGQKINGQYDCSYVFNLQNILIENYCFKDSNSIGYYIFYYENGVIKAFEPLLGEDVHGNKIDYFEDGSINTITQFNRGKANGLIKIYYPSGNLKAINLVENDSIYYARFYTDSLMTNKFTEAFFPIVILENDTFPINDSIEIKIQFPLNPGFGLDTGKFILRYDKLPAELLKGKNPYAKYSTDITGEDIWIGVGAGVESYDKFYCYVTDKDGNNLGPIIYRDLHFIK